MTAPGGDPWRHAATGIAARERVPLDVHTVGADVVLDEGGAREWCNLYGVDDDGAVLIRPDGHVAWRMRSLPADPAVQLQQALARALRPPP